MPDGDVVAFGVLVVEPEVVEVEPDELEPVELEPEVFEFDDVDIEVVVDVDADVSFDVDDVDVEASVPVPVLPLVLVVVVFCCADAGAAVVGVDAERGWVRAESVRVAVVEEPRCEAKECATEPVMVSGLRCLPVPAAGTTSVCWSAVSTTPMLVMSADVVDAWVCWPPAPPRFIAETVSPPPTRATAVATTARRWFFFQRTFWRRRAARPSVRGIAASGSSNGASASGDSSGSGQSAVVARTWEVRPPGAIGARSGA